MRSLDIGIAFELRSDFEPRPGAPIDALEEYDTSETIDALAHALAGLGHRPRLLGGGRRFLEAMLANPPQLVFNNAEGRGGHGREAQVPALCEMLEVPCTHSDPLAMALTLDKACSKRVLLAAGVRTAPFRVVETPADAARVDLPFPLFVKPVAEGSSMGIRDSSRVSDRDALAREVERCLDAYRQPALVEQYLPGAEVTVGIVGCGGGSRGLGSMEIAPVDGRAPGFVYGLETKRNYLQLVRYHAPPRSPTRAQCAAAESLALAAYRALGCRDVARIDLRFDAVGNPHFLEANALPGLNPVTGDLVVMTGLLGMSYQTLIGHIVEEAVRRYPALH